MCGIAGFFNPDKSFFVNKKVLTEMTSTLYHRGPDDEGYFFAGNIGLGHRRLSIIDLSGGQQPIYNEDDSICIVFNGEIFNYIELMDILKKKGHHFKTHSDTEVIVHAYEEYGIDCLQHFNGQWAFAIWDSRKQRLFIARDRIGIRPLFYTFGTGNTLVFASEIKALFKYQGIQPQIDPAGLEQIFTLWANIPPSTVFKNIAELAPGHFLTFDSSGMTCRRFWKLTYPSENEYQPLPETHYIQKFQELMNDSVKIRLRADVPVAAYLSGGIDSSVITAIIKKYHNNNLMTFSVAFKDREFDETEYQMEMVNFLSTNHRMITVDYDSIGNAFSDVVKFAEKPMIRTAPGPLFLLSGLVRENNIKVVLTGEGADEMLGGYDIFKEDRIRRFWARNPDSKYRPALFSRIYPDIRRNASMMAFWQNFFKKSLTDTENQYYSHLIRWNNTSHLKLYFNQNYCDNFNPENNIYQPLNGYIDPAITSWHPLCRAQYLESILFLSGYLLSSQGDRMLMGHSVEGRFPFLDYRIMEFCSSIPPSLKMFILNEKFLLKKAYGHLLPASIVQRAKKPYRAPISKCFLPDRTNLGAQLLRPEYLKKYGYFDEKIVSKLIQKMVEQKTPLSERENMAVSAIVSTQLLHYHFIENHSSN